MKEKKKERKEGSNKLQKIKEISKQMTDGRKKEETTKEKENGKKRERIKQC